MVFYLIPSWEHLISRREMWTNWQEHSRGLPTWFWGQSMVYKEKVKELVGQCPTQSGLVLTLALLSSKVRPNNLQRSLPTYIFLWRWHTYMAYGQCCSTSCISGLRHNLVLSPLRREWCCQVAPCFGTRDKEKLKTLGKKNSTVNMECCS